MPGQFLMFSFVAVVAVVVQCSCLQLFSNKRREGVLFWKPMVKTL